MTSTACAYGNPEDCFGVHYCHQCKGRKMGMVQEDAKVLYAFSGRFQIARQEAMCAILTHEKIPYTTGVGTQCCVVEVAPEHSARVREVIQQWYEAMHAVHQEVWSK
jgi:hypothetical protein